MYYSLTQGKYVTIPLGMESPPEPDPQDEIDRKRKKYLANRLRTLDERKAKMEYMGVKRDSMRWKSLMYDILTAQAEYNELCKPKDKNGD